MKTTSGRIDRSVAIVPIPGLIFHGEVAILASTGNHEIGYDNLASYPRDSAAINDISGGK